MKISAFSISAGMSLFSFVSILGAEWGLLLYIFLIYTFFAPVSVLFIICVMGFFPKLKFNKYIGHFYAFCHGMCMVDVFVLGVLVSLIKLTSLAEVSFYIGFYTTFLFSVLLLWCCLKVKPERLWYRVKIQEKLNLIPGMTAMAQGYTLCSECGYVHRADSSCPRCGAKSHYRKPQCISKSLCLLLSALILYLPSNLYPVMYTEYLGQNTGSNIIDGVIAMWDMKSYFVAIVILLASIFIPAFKIISLGLILYVSTKSKIHHKRYLSRLYRIVHFIGRWSLIDVYVVIIMSAIVRISGVIIINPGFAIICFCSVVILTIFSTEAFDERLIWDK